MTEQVPPLTRPAFTIVIPAFNEAANIGAVIEEVLAATAERGDEILVIDDGSDDKTGEVAAAVSTDPRLRVITHKGRAGKSAALRTAALNARAIWMGTMDGDGQDDPQDLLAMAALIDLTKVDEVGLVGGVRQQRTDGTSRKWVSRIGNGIRKRVLRDNCPDTACGLKVIPADVFLALPFFDSMHRYLPALVQHLGFSALYHPVTNRPRMSGASKYTNIGRAAAGAVDLMGVAWLLRRTSVPAREQILRPHPMTQDQHHGA